MKKKIALVLLLALALTICGCVQNTTDSPETTAPPETGVKLYWNIDRLDYLSGGESTRPVTGDGTYAVRFAVDGKQETLQVADKATLNTIDFNDVIALELNAQGVVVGAKTVSELNLTAVQDAYVSGTNGTTVSCNTMINNKGVPFDLTTTSSTVIYNVSQKDTTCGGVDTLQENDKILAIQDEQENVTHIYIVERSAYNLKHDDHCVCNGLSVGVGTHTCDTNTSGWEAWTNPYAMPTSGKYYLTCDVTVTRNGKDDGDARVLTDIAGDLTLCLNGFTADAAACFRFNNLYQNVTVNICDCTGEGIINSARRNEIEDQKLVQMFFVKDNYDGFPVSHTINVFGGNLVGTDNCSTGGIFALNGTHTLNIYGGTLHGGTAIGKPTVYPNGSVMYLQKGATCNMYGGTITGGSAVVQTSVPEYLGGKGGQIYIDQGTFNMYGGTITGGKVTTTDPTNCPGLGGNIYVSANGALNLYGGTITDGEATKGANILVVETGIIKIVDVAVTTAFTADATATVDTSAVGTGVTVTNDGTEYTVTKAAS